MSDLALYDDYPLDELKAEMAMLRQTKTSLLVALEPDTEALKNINQCSAYVAKLIAKFPLFQSDF